MNINLTLFGQAITFAIFVWFTMRFVWPPLTTAMQERQQKIADGLQAAEQGVLSLAAAEEEAQSLLKEAKAQAALLIEQANKRGDQLVEEAKAKAREEAARVVTAAQTDIEQQKNQAREALRQEVVSLSLLGAEKVLARAVNQDDHEKMLSQLAANM